MTSLTSLTSLAPQLQQLLRIPHFGARAKWGPRMHLTSSVGVNPPCGKILCRRHKMLGRADARSRHSRVSLAGPGQLFLFF